MPNDFERIFATFYFAYFRKIFRLFLQSLLKDVNKFNSDFPCLWLHRLLSQGYFYHPVKFGFQQYGNWIGGLLATDEITTVSIEPLHNVALTMAGNRTRVYCLEGSYV